MNSRIPSRPPRVRQLRILLAETSPGEVGEALRSIFSGKSESLELTTVSAASVLISTIQLVRPEVAFVDLALKPADPLRLVRAIHRMIPDVPLIALADSADKDCADQSLREGAADYLLKGHAEPRIVERVLRAALERNTVSGLTDLLRDPATGFYNREGFAALAARIMQSAQKAGSGLILLIVEIENLQRLKREFGSAGSDQAVQDVAALLRASFRRTDVLARQGETLFAVLVLDALEPTAALMRQRIERHLVALNQTRSAQGQIVLKFTTTFWNAASQEPSDQLALLAGIRVPSTQSTDFVSHRNMTGGVV